MMTVGQLAALALLTLTLGSCAAKAQVRPEVELPLLDPPPPPPRVVTIYQDEVEPVPAAPTVEPVPSRPVGRPPRPEARLEPVVTPEPVLEVAKPSPPPSLTLTPTPGSEAQTVVAIRELMARATRDLARVNVAGLTSDGRAQVEAARRFLQQADEALKARNLVFAGKLADKAAIMAALLVR